MPRPSSVIVTWSSAISTSTRVAPARRAFWSISSMIWRSEASKNRLTFEMAAGSMAALIVRM